MIFPRKRGLGFWCLVEVGCFGLVCEVFVSFDRVVSGGLNNSPPLPAELFTAKAAGAACPLSL